MNDKYEVKRKDENKARIFNETISKIRNPTYLRKTGGI
jgi:hypothetical protein